MPKVGETFNCPCGFGGMVVTGELDTDPPAIMGWGMMPMGDKLERPLGAHVVVDGQHCSAWDLGHRPDVLKKLVQPQIDRARQGLPARINEVEQRLQEAHEKQHGIIAFDRALLARYLPLLEQERSRSLKAAELFHFLEKIVSLNRPDASGTIKVTRKTVESLRDWLEAQPSGEEPDLLGETNIALAEAH